MSPSKAQKSKKLKVLSSEVLCKGRVFEIRRDRVVEPSGVEAIRDWIVHPGSVVVVPVFDDGRVLLIRQYRHAAGQELWELVAGHKEQGEDPVDGARRELREETGYSAEKFSKLTEIYPSPGMLSERMDIFLATGLTKGKAQPEEDEKISTRIFTLAQVEEWIRSGKIRDGKSLAGILYYAQFVAAKNKALRGGRRGKRTR